MIYGIVLDDSAFTKYIANNGQTKEKIRYFELEIAPTWNGGHIYAITDAEI